MGVCVGAGRGGMQARAVDALLTARTHKLIPVVHAVDDTGALCGARPRNGRWVPNTKLPVTCPKCMVRMTLPRYTLCLVPSSLTSKRRPLRHIRRVGAEGVMKSSGPVRLETLCGANASHDLELLERTPTPGDESNCPRCVRAMRQERTGLSVAE